MRKQCKVEGCTDFPYRDNGYCQKHHNTCACGQRIHKDAKRCKQCYNRERSGDPNYVLQSNAGTGPKSPPGFVNEIKYLVRCYYQARHDERFKELARIRIPQLIQQLKSCSSNP